MRLVTSWRIAERSASFWSSSIFWFWTSCAAATASSWSCSTWRSSRRASRASRCASFSDRRSWSAIARCSERMVSMSARLWMLERRSSQSRSPVLYRVAARLARISRCRSSAFSARLRSMRERVQALVDLVELGLRLDQVVCPTVCSSVCRSGHLGARALGLLLQLEERGGGRRRRRGHGGRERQRREDARRAAPRRPPRGAARLVAVPVCGGDGPVSDHVAALRALCFGYRPGWALLDRWTGRRGGAGLYRELRAAGANPSR